MGTLSRGLIGVPQCGHRDGGRTTDSPTGHRATHTFRKEPMHAPNANASAPRSQFMPGSSVTSLRGADVWKFQLAHLKSRPWP